MNSTDRIQPLNMNVGLVYEIRLGRYADKYLATGNFDGRSIELRRARTPKTKIDAVRLPETISITYTGSIISRKAHP